VDVTIKRAGKSKKGGRNWHIMAKKIRSIDQI